MNFPDNAEPSTARHAMQLARQVSLRVTHLATCYLITRSGEDMRANRRTVGSPTSAFLPGPAASPHAQRAKAILQKHPDVRKLIGRDPSVVVIAATVSAFQIGVASLLQGASPLVVLVAAGFGAFPAITQYATDHEFSHGNVLKSASANKLAAIITSLARGIPSTGHFLAVHPAHHRLLGSYLYDLDVPAAWEASLFSRNPLTKLLFLALFPVLSALRAGRALGHIGGIDRWIVLNYLLQLLVNALVVYAWGWSALGYLVLSSYLAVGPHPLGARVIQEHFVVEEGHETNDYDGPASPFLLFGGRHAGHHDFVGIPASRLRKLYVIASEFYTPVPTYSSYTALLFEFLRSSKRTLWRRIVR